MNAVLDPSMERSGGQAVQSTANLSLRKMVYRFPDRCLENFQPSYKTVLRDTEHILE